MSKSATTQLKCLFWNVGRKSLDVEIIALAQSTDANVISLAEYKGDELGLLKGFIANGLDFFLVPRIGCDRIHLFTKFQPSHIKPGPEKDRYTIKELTIPGRKRLLICFTHLPDKRNNDDLDQHNEATFFRTDIESAEKNANHQNTIVLGDFNMNPFDDGMVSAIAMNSVSSLALARREKRVINKREHTFFYNPSWNLLGDFNGAPGTYYHSSPNYRSNYWHLLDQLLLRPSIAHCLDQSSLQILTKAGITSLLSAKGKPRKSDHLPLFFTLDMQ